MNPVDQIPNPSQNEIPDHGTSNFDSYAVNQFSVWKVWQKWNIDDPWLLRAHGSVFREELQTITDLQEVCINGLKSFCENVKRMEVIQQPLHTKIAKKISERLHLLS